MRVSDRVTHSSLGYNIDAEMRWTGATQMYQNQPEAFRLSKGSYSPHNETVVTLDQVTLRGIPAIHAHTTSRIHSACSTPNQGPPQTNSAARPCLILAEKIVDAGRHLFATTGIL